MKNLVERQTRNNFFQKLNYFFSMSSAECLAELRKLLLLKLEKRFRKGE